jgi:hypothetical protein
MMLPNASTPGLSLRIRYATDAVVSRWFLITNPTMPCARANFILAMSAASTDPVSVSGSI